MPSPKDKPPKAPSARGAAKQTRPAARRSSSPASDKVETAQEASSGSKKRGTKKAGRVAARRSATTGSQASTSKAAKPKPSTSKAASTKSRAATKKTKSSKAASDAEPKPKPKARASRSTATGSRPKARAKASSSKVASAKPQTADAAVPAEAAVGTTSDGAVLVTGICGRLGRLLARRLHRTDRVVGVDRRPFLGRPKDIVHHELDLRRKTTRDLFRGGNVRAVVHLGVLHDPRASDKEHHSWNIVGFQKLLEYLTRYRVPKLVVLSSANVYGPQPDNSQFLTEDAPLLGAQNFRGIRDLVELDMLAQGFFWKNPETETVILRPCHILGRVHNAASNYLRLGRPMTILGFDPMIQPIHERDVVEAVLKALKPGVRGIFNLRGPGEAPLSRLLAMLKRRPRPVPAMVARPVLERLWTYRLTSFPAPEIDYLRFLCMVDDARARNVLGHAPQFDLGETLHAVDADR